MLFAHSPDPKRGIEGQDYSAHRGGVVRLASKAAAGVAQFASRDGEVLKTVLRLAAEYHDLGKLDDENQEVLSGKRKAKHLPVQHTDAGTAYLLNTFRAAPSAAIVSYHHIGLQDFIEEENRNEESIFRDDEVRQKVDGTLPHLVDCTRAH